MTAALLIFASTLLPTPRSVAAFDLRSLCVYRCDDGEPRELASWNEDRVFLIRAAELDSGGTWGEGARIATQERFADAVKGDVDGDGLTGPAEAAALRACLAGPGDVLDVEPACNCRCALDFDWDGDVDLSDAVELQRMVRP